MAKQNSFESKLDIVKIFKIIDIINKSIITIGNIDKEFQVKAGNLALKMIHEMLLEERIISEPWPGIPDEIADKTKVEELLTKSIGIKNQQMEGIGISITEIGQIITEGERINMLNIIFKAVQKEITKEENPADLVDYIFQSENRLRDYLIFTILSEFKKELEFQKESELKEQNDIKDWFSGKGKADQAKAEQEKIKKLNEDIDNLSEERRFCVRKEGEFAKQKKIIEEIREKEKEIAKLREKILFTQNQYDPDCINRFRKKLYQKAIECFDERLRINSKHRFAHFHKGFTLKKIGEYIKAIQSLKNSLPEYKDAVSKINFDSEVVGCLLILKAIYEKEFSTKISDTDGIFKNAKVANSAAAVEQMLKSGNFPPSFHLILRMITEELDKRGSLLGFYEEFFDAIEIINKDNNFLRIFDKIAEDYLQACVNQPVAGFTQIALLFEMAKKDSFESKLDMVKIFKIIDTINKSIIKISNICKEISKTRANPDNSKYVIGKQVEVEAGNLALKIIHEMLLKEKIISEPWPGIPDKIAYEEIVKPSLTEEIKDQEILEEIEKILISKEEIKEIAEQGKPINILNIIFKVVQKEITKKENPTDLVDYIFRFGDPLTSCLIFTILSEFQEEKDHLRYWFSGEGIADQGKEQQKEIERLNQNINNLNQNINNLNQNINKNINNLNQNINNLNQNIDNLNQNINNLNQNINKLSAGNEKHKKKPIKKLDQQIRDRIKELDERKKEKEEEIKKLYKEKEEKEEEIKKLYKEKKEKEEEIIELEKNIINIRKQYHIDCITSFKGKFYQILENQAKQEQILENQAKQEQEETNKVLKFQGQQQAVEEQFKVVEPNSPSSLIQNDSFRPLNNEGIKYNFN